MSQRCRISECIKVQNNANGLRKTERSRNTELKGSAASLRDTGSFDRQGVDISFARASSFVSVIRTTRLITEGTVGTLRADDSSPYLQPMQLERLSALRGESKWYGG